MRLAGRTALVTGAARGISLAITARLVADGARVVIADLDAAAAKEAATRLGDNVAALVPYSTAKAGVIGLTKASRREPQGDSATDSTYGIVDIDRR